MMKLENMNFEQFLNFPNVEPLNHFLTTKISPVEVQDKYVSHNEKRNPETETKKEDDKYFGIKIYDCPPSLKLLVKVYRCIGFSFAGLTFKRDQEGYYLNAKQKWPHRCTAFGMIVVNLAILISYIVPFLYRWYRGTRMVDALFVTPHEATSNQTVITATAMATAPMIRSDRSAGAQDMFGLHQYQREFRTLKPILRMVMQSVIYTFVAEGFFSYAVNLVFGGRLIRLIAQIPKLRQLDRDGLFARRLITVKLTVLVSINLVGLVLFNQRELWIMYRYCSEAHFTLDAVTKFELFKFAVLSFMNFSHFLIISMVPALFLYVMVMFSRHVTQVQEAVGKEQLTETDLYRIKHHLTTLSEHFRAVVQRFGAALTLTIITNVFLMIGSFCFMMIHHSRQTRHYYVSLIFEFGIFALVRLVAVCAAANLVTIAYDELIRAIFESVPQWTVDGWMCFVEVKRLRDRFEVVFFGTYRLAQTTILTVLGFALNYVVVLLQTEDYSASFD